MRPLHQSAWSVGTTVAILSLAALVVAACGTARQVHAGQAVPAPTAADGAATGVPGGPAWEGTWYVSAVFPSASTSGSAADPHLGAAVAIGAGEVSDVNGQRCVTPGFISDTTTASMGGPGTGKATAERLRVTCQGADFATFLRVPPVSASEEVPGTQTGRSARAIFAERPEALYLLEPADLVLYRQATEPAMWAKPPSTMAEGPAPLDQPEQASAPEKPVDLVPAPEGPVADVAPEPAASGQAAPAVVADMPGMSPLPAPGTAIHLASYKGISAAKRGWKILLGENDELDPLSPLFVSLNIAGKGDIIRLYANGADEAELGRICAALKARGVYCTLKP